MSYIFHTQTSDLPDSLALGEQHTQFSLLSEPITGVHTPLHAAVTKWVKRLSPQKVNVWSHRSAGHFGDRVQVAVFRLVLTPDLVRSYVFLCHCKYQSHYCRFPPMQRGPLAMRHGPSTTLTHETSQKMGFPTGMCVLLL